jgi:hypothetical protein
VRPIFPQRRDFNVCPMRFPPGRLEPQCATVIHTICLDLARYLMQRTKHHVRGPLLLTVTDPQRSMPRHGASVIDSHRQSRNGSVRADLSSGRAVGLVGG